MVALFVISALAGLSAGSLNAVSALVFACFYRRGAAELRAAQYEHDAANAVSISEFPSEVLDAVDCWLEQKMKRIERRLSFYFGGSDKLAIFAVVGLGWAAWDALIAKGQIAVAPTPLTYGLAGLAGLAIGGVGLRMIVDRLAYSRDIIALARKLNK